MNSVTAQSHQQMANAIRVLSMDAVEHAKSGHPGMPMGMADVVTVLFSRFIKIDPAFPSWPDRDRFVLSAGHGSMLQYALHHLLGYADMPMDELRRFRQLGSRAAGHPEFGHTLGVETTTGPLGQGIATAAGMALAERMLNARFGDDLVDHYTYVIAGDGCLMEGISHEAIEFAGHLGLRKLIVFWDDNGISIDGPTSLANSGNQALRFEAAGWNVLRVDGHAPDAIAKAIQQARLSKQPSLIACRTIIGFGAPNKQGTEAVHGSPLGEQEVVAARKKLQWAASPFEIPQAVRSGWQAIAAHGQTERELWQDRLARSARKKELIDALSGNLPECVVENLRTHKRALLAERPAVATRKASETALAVINKATELTIGGSADLTHSNLTITKGLAAIKPASYGGRYIHYGVREHGIAAAMNGIALHGGFIPYGGTFLVFSDYARGAIRLSAMMKQRVIYVLTHDSIGLGEDGPTHQPIEHLAMLRATPNLDVLRPADAVETTECWELALTSRERPSVLCLSRQNLPVLRKNDTGETMSGYGAYVLREPDGPRDVTLLATGSEVEIAVKAAALLADNHAIRVAVVSMPSWKRFEEQPQTYRNAVLGGAPRIAIEAAARLGWDRWIGENGIFIGMQGFGASAPASALYEHFGITSKAVAEAAISLIGSKGGNACRSA